MKKILLFSLLVQNAIFTFSQTLEHHYIGNNGQIYQVSPNEFVYGILDDSLKQFKVYSLDHTLMNTISLKPDSATGNMFTIITFQGLYLTVMTTSNCIQLVEFCIGTFHLGVKILNDNGTEVFSKDSAFTVGLFNTSEGSKMLLGFNTPYQYRRNVDV